MVNGATWGMILDYLFIDEFSHTGHVKSLRIGHGEGDLGRQKRYCLMGLTELTALCSIWYFDNIFPFSKVDLVVVVMSDWCVTPLIFCQLWVVELLTRGRHCRKHYDRTSGKMCNLGVDVRSAPHNKNHDVKISWKAEIARVSLLF